MDNKFSYTYSAKRNAEVDSIRQKYLPKQSMDDDKLRQLKAMDRSCELPGKIASIIVGIMGTGLFIFSVMIFFRFDGFLIGSLLGVAGLGIMAAAVPVYYKITDKKRKQLAPEILKLTDELTDRT